ncbi:MAG: glycosyltransferase [Candidatus Omnitrophota bacterium]
MRPQPFFSVIIPTFNRARFIEKAVRSVLRQSSRDLELIVVDDGSDDGTEGLISSFRDERIVYRKQANRGVSSARNKGIGLSKGAFIAFLDSDDRWTEEKLKKTAAYIRKFPNIKIFHTEEVWYKNGRVLPQKKKHKKPSGFVYGDAVRLCCIGASTAVIKRDVFESIGTFDEDMEACEDYDLWLRATAKYAVKLIPEALTIKDGGRPDQLSSKVWGLDRLRIRALAKMLSSGELDDEKYKITYDELEKKCKIFAAGCEKREKKEEVAYYQHLPERFIRKKKS